MKRVLICTFVALASGFFGSYVGGQMSAIYRTQPCQAQFWGLNMACKSLLTPVAMWQGSTTGLWTGMVLGAFIAGLATSKYQDPQQRPDEKTKVSG